MWGWGGGGRGVLVWIVINRAWIVPLIELRISLAILHLKFFDLKKAHMSMIALMAMVRGVDLPRKQIFD